MAIKITKKNVGARLIVTSKWVSNGHWLIRRSALCSPCVLPQDLDALSVLYGASNVSCEGLTDVPNVEGLLSTSRGRLTKAECTVWSHDGAKESYRVFAREDGRCFSLSEAYAKMLGLSAGSIVWEYDGFVASDEGNDLQWAVMCCGGPVSCDINWPWPAKP